MIEWMDKYLISLFLRLNDLTEMRLVKRLKVVSLEQTTTDLMSDIVKI